MSIPAIQALIVALLVTCGIKLSSRVLTVARRRRWERLHQEGRTALDEGRLDDARARLEEALELARPRMLQDAGFATTLTTLGLVQAEAGDVVPSETSYRRALDLYARVPGDYREARASLHALLGQVQARDDRPREAAESMRRSLHQLTEVLGPEAEEVEGTRCSLALLLQADGRAGEAEALLETERERRRQAGGGFPFRTQVCLGGILKEEGRLRTARELLREALARRGPDVNGADVAGVLYNLADLYFHEENFVDAETLYLQALAGFERELGSAHPFYPSCLGSLAAVAERQGREAEAEALYQDVLDRWEEIYGVEHPTVAATLCELAEFYFGQGELEKSERCQRRAIEVWESCLGPDHPDLAPNLESHAVLLRETNRLEEARAAEERARNLRATLGAAGSSD